jgi:hypothetical protein
VISKRDEDVRRLAQLPTGHPKTRAADDEISKEESVTDPLYEIF